MPRHSARPPGRCPRPSRASPRASWRRWTTTSTRRRRSACCSNSLARCPTRATAASARSRRAPTSWRASVSWCGWGACSASCGAASRRAGRQRRSSGSSASVRTREKLTAMAGSPEHQGVVARVTSAEYVDLEDLLAEPVQRSQPPFYLVLDQVQDPRNLGAILRTAEAFGVHGVVIPKHHAVGLTDAAARTAMGALERVPVARATNLVAALETIKESGAWVYGAAAHDGIAPWAADLRGPVCLVLGSEGEGLRPLVARACDAMLAIPMAGG